MRLFTNHPRAVGESYFEHLQQAAGFGVVMVVGGAACLIHALLPFLFKDTASRVTARLHDRLVIARDRRRNAGTTAPAE